MLTNHSTHPPVAFAARRRRFDEAPHWADNFHDSPWLEGSGCDKSMAPSELGHSDVLQCYSAKCAPPSVKSFSCDAAADDP